MPTVLPGLMEFLFAGASARLGCSFSFCMVDRITYFLALGIISVIRCLPLGAAFVLGQSLGALLWAILPSYRRLARENLTRVFGEEKTPAEIRALTFKHFTTLGANSVCALNIAGASQKVIAKAAWIAHPERLQKHLAAGRPAVIAINHIGNWELYAQMVFMMPEIKFGTVYQALRNKPLDDLINQDRRRLGVATFDRKRGFNEAIALLRQPGVVGVLVDQNAGDGGIFMPFFNRLSSTSPLAATLAIRTEAAVVPIAIFTEGFAKWRVEISEEVPYDPAQPEQLTLDINKALERQIRESPADWFWVHNRWKTPLPHFLTVTQKRGVYLPESEKEKLKPFRIVVRSPNWLGDAVMSFRAARAFKLGRPDSKLAILTPAKLAGLWKLVPEVDEIIPFEPRESIFSVARKIRGRFDVAVLFPNSLRSALEAWLAGVPRRFGYRGHNREYFLNQIPSEKKKKKKKVAPKPEHHADRYFTLAEKCGGVEPPPLPRRSRPAPGKPVLGVCPGAEYGPAKRWPAESFRKTMDLVSTKLDCKWVILGVAADQPIAAEIIAGFPGEVEDLTGKTSLDGLVETLETLTALVTNDTGTMHLADFLGVPLVSIFGSTEPDLTGPRNEKSVVIRHRVECSPCFLRDCPVDFRCMAAVTPEEVSSRMLELVNGGQ